MASSTPPSTAAASRTPRGAHGGRPGSSPSRSSTSYSAAVAAPAVLQLKPSAFFSVPRIFRRDPCAGRYVYMYDLPPRFNADLVRECRRISGSTDVCKDVANDGFGPPIKGGGEAGSLPESGAYDTDQYMLGLIFHARMRRHECLTADPAAAAVVYVPFYAGLDSAMHLGSKDLAARDALSRDVVDWLAQRPEWRAMGGRDHLLVSGRGTWDFIVNPDAVGWGNALMTFPAILNATFLTTEAQPLHMAPAERPPELLRLHPARRRGRAERQHRGGAEQDTAGEGGADAGAGHPAHPGCIPVFFHPVSAYLQYIWHLPRDHRSYSVFIPHGDVVERNASIEEVLSRIPPAKVAQMREQVIRLIPTVLYRHPAAKGVTFKDAFDVALERVIDRVAKRRRAAAEGREYVDSIDGKFSWKYDLAQDREKMLAPHEFDPYINT
uniref:Exostosin GT47 domain-containing protein n=1 Tax=Aegilops tauschii TaxID=37682 RepID=M8CF47_AEGTA